MLKLRPYPFIKDDIWHDYLDYVFPAYRRLMKSWIVPGVPAFLAIVLIIYLMVTKAGIADPVFAQNAERLLGTLARM
ncbi:DUF2269 family protein [Marinobacterium sedimentorum]|uniref:DUF2269 family protein n=1 Tax=Marinobacterium sedimentorum TaxID=2927804 RepID=UPI0020C67FA2|nr:DUF2269 family protein [Marinobacterium sedimentorum]MCP8686534.1 DUF2269 domain-containing protein [Marinobacterium sedimentorum]